MAHGKQRHRSGIRSWLALAGFGLAVAAVAAVGGLGVRSTAAEYQSLTTPPWAPPSWVFGPVWTVLYLTIAFAGWLAWRRAGWTTGLTWYAVQLVLNAAWTPLFFGAGWYFVALLDIAALLLALSVTIALFWRVSRLAALLLVPYWAWVAFATALNAAVVRLN